MMFVNENRENHPLIRKNHVAYTQGSAANKLKTRKDFSSQPVSKSNYFR